MQRSTATEAPICGAAVSRWRLSGDHAWVQRDGSSSLALAELEDAAVHDQAPSSFDSTDKAAVRSRFCPNWADTVLAVLARHLPDREIRVMGSRVTGRAKRFSDLDLVVMGEEPLALRTLAELRDAFDDSDLPFSVDIVEWASASEAFRRVISMQARSLRPAAGLSPDVLRVTHLEPDRAHGAPASSSDE